jgi:Flp pilus assembly protein TadD
MISDGDVRGGLEVLIDASELSPDNDNAWVAVASAYLRNDRRADAFDALRKAVELNPNNRVRLPNNQNFASVVDDPEFRRIVGN